MHLGGQHFAAGMGLPNACATWLRSVHPYAEAATRPALQEFALPEAPATAAALRFGSVRTEEMQRLEAVLLLAREPLPSRKLAWLAHLDDGTRARTLIRKLNQWYDQSGRAFRVEEVAGGYQMLTRQKFATWLRRLGHVPGEVRLSSPALETLAVIAYRQPVLKADIEAIRGVHCGEILRQLMERDLVRIGGRSDELGRPYLYQVTRRFMQIFGIRNLEELPRAEFLRDNPLPPVHKSSASGHHTSSDSVVFGEPKPSREKKESDVSVTLKSELAYEETRNAKFGPALLPHIRAEEDDEDDFEDEDELDDDDDDFEDDEEDEDFDDEEEEEDDFDDEDLEEDEDWEEVDDEDEDLDEEEDDEDWDDEDEDDDDWEEDEAEDDADDKE